MADGQGDRVQGDVLISLWGQVILHGEVSRGRALPLGQAVDLVIGGQYRDIQTPSYGVDEMISSFAVVAAVTGVCNDSEVRPGQLDPDGKRQGRGRGAR